MKQPIFQGVATAMITPMYDDFSINYPLFGALLEAQIAHHADAVVIAGTTGEGSTLTDDEQLELIAFAVKQVNGRIPVIANVGSNNTVHAVYMSRRAQRIGADALLHITPYYNKTSQRGLFLHFQACAQATDLPIILYNVPSRTGMTIQLETYQRLCELDSIVAVKEASGDLQQCADILSACGNHLAMYAGNDDQIASMMQLGAQGSISVLSNLVPEVVHSLCDECLHGNNSLGAQLQAHYAPLVQALFSDVNPIPIKCAMQLAGYPVGPCRLPLCDMEADAAAHLRQTLAQYHLTAR